MGAALVLAGCANARPADTWPVPLHEAFERLRAADMAAFRDARQCGILIHFARQAVADQSVTWRVTSSGRELVRFTARLIPVGAGETRVAIEIPADPKGGRHDGGCSVQRAGLEAGRPFAIDDRPGEDAAGSRRHRAAEDAAWEADLADYGQPSDDTHAAATDSGW